MGLILAIIGIVLLLLGYFLIGVILIVIGVILFMTWEGGYGYGHWRGRRGPP